MTRAESRRRSSEDQAHRNAVTDTTKDAASFLSDLLGAKLVAYITDADDTTVRRWCSGANAPRDAAERRMLAASHIAHMLLEAGDATHTVRAWFMGMNPQLGDETPADVIRTDRPREALAAARAFIGTA